MHKVAIGIPTYQRPKSLLRLLDSINQLKFSAQFCVFVVDNDNHSQSAINLLAGRLADYRFTLHTRAVAPANISVARNMLLQMVFEEHDFSVIAMVDDDEIVDCDWLNQLVNCQLQSEADIVQGNTLPNFLVKVEPWMSQVPFFYRHQLMSSHDSMALSSCNILITKAIYQKMHGQLFDLQFGISGGEDTDFFHRAKALGAKFAYEGKALAYEDYDQLRATKSWVRKRSFRVGQTNVKIFHQNRSGFIFSLKIFARFLVNLVRLALLCWHPAHSIRYQMKICRQWGMLLAACGSS